MSGAPDAARPGAAVALFGLPPAGTWLWLARPDALEAAAIISLVLLHHLPGLLVAIGAAVAGRG